MDHLSFWASLIKSLAWPLVTLCLFISYKETLSKIFSNLKSLKIKDFELIVQSQISKAEQEFPEASTINETSKPNKEEQDNIRILAEISPRAALLEAWYPFEVTVNKIGKELGIINDGHASQINDLVNGLKNSGILNEEEVNAIIRMRNIRNSAIHTENFILSASSVSEYSKLLNRIIKTMTERAFSKNR